MLSDEYPYIQNANVPDGHYDPNPHDPTSKTYPVPFHIPQFTLNGSTTGADEVISSALYKTNGMPMRAQTETSVSVPGEAGMDHPHYPVKLKSTPANTFIHEGLADPLFLQQPIFPTASGAPLNLPLYSASGFDILPVLSRVVNRPKPQVNLGPVDLTSTFCVSDPRREDHPIVYVSPSFCDLTGYSEKELLGRNCRLLQSPPPSLGLQELVKGGKREYTSEAEVAAIAKAIATGLECQVTLMNYKKDGTAFLNLVTIIPIHGEVTVDVPDGQVVYHIGFQIDLSEQSNAMLERLIDGRYIVDNTFANLGPDLGKYLSPKDKRQGAALFSNSISPELTQLFNDPYFRATIPLDLTSNEHSLGSSIESLSNVLLNLTPDFVHVLSLKGSFLYCSPRVKNVLGWDNEELIGKSLSDICHPADLVAVLRELKEGSSSSSLPNDDSCGGFIAPSSSKKDRTIGLLFRALTKRSAGGGQPEDECESYVWLECRGRVYSEPGKGRKAVILSGRAREMESTNWEDVALAGGVLPSVIVDSSSRKKRKICDEIWGLMSPYGSILSIGEAAKDFAGWDRQDLLGTSISSLFQVQVNELLGQSSSWSVSTPCMMLRKDGSSFAVVVTIYRRSSVSTDLAGGTCASTQVFQIRLASTSHTAGAVISTGPLFGPFTPTATADGGANWSWQYEVQQLRYDNIRLVEQVERLEEMIVTSADGRPAKRPRSQESELYSTQALHTAPLSNAPPATLASVPQEPLRSTRHANLRFPAMHHPMPMLANDWSQGYA